MRLFDATDMTKPVIDGETGNMLVSSRCAKVGVQTYRGADLGRPQTPWVSVFRPADEVFSKDSLESFAAVPVTIGHPKNFVDADTWKDVAVGETDQEILRDGDAVRVPFTLRHKRAIKAVQDGKVQISMGYHAEIDWTPGITDSGEAYDAIQRNIRINHLAIVDAARGGPTLRIGDEGTKTMKKLVFDGIEVSIEDHAAVESGVKKLEGKIADQAKAIDDAITAKDATEAKMATEATTAATALADEQAKVATLEAQIVTLNTQLADAQSPEKLADAAAARASLIDTAAKLGVADAEKMKDAEIRKAAVNARLGDKAANWTDAQIAVSFDTLAASIKAEDGMDPYRAAMNDRKIVDFGDAKAKADAAYREAYGLSA